MKELPPGPALSPEQQARLWIERPLELLDACAREFGDVFALRLGALGTTVMVGEPESVRAIFRAPADAFECRHFNESYRFVMGDNAPFLQDGEGHRRIRRVVTPPLCHEGMSERARAICRIAGEMLDRPAAGEAVAVRPLLHELALRVLMDLVFGDRREAGERVVGWFLSEVWRDQRAWKPWTSLSRLQPRLRALIADELEYRRGPRPPGREPDLLDYLLAARDEEGQPLEETETEDQVLTLLITAVNPVAFATTWLLDWVARSPEVQAAVRGEVEAAGADVNPVELARRPYLAATCQETLRIHPILPTVSGRRLATAMEVGGYQLEPGINVAAVRLPGAPTGGALSRAAGLPPRAVPVASVRPARILPVRRRAAAVPGDVDRAPGDGAGAGDGRGAMAAGPGRARRGRRPVRDAGRPARRVEDPLRDAVTRREGRASRPAPEGHHEGRSA